MEENKELSFFKRLIISIKDFDKYKIFALENLGKSFKYIIILSLILMIFIATTFTFKYATIINKTINYINKELPEFTYENGILNFNTNDFLEYESSKDTKNASYKIIIDTRDIDQTKLDEYKKNIDLYNYGAIILKDKIIINSYLLTEKVEKNYSEIESTYGIVSKFNKQDMVNYINKFNIYVVYFEIFTFLYLYLFASYFLAIIMDAVLLAILGVITARIIKVKIKFASSYAMALHALTLPIILNVIYIIVNSIIGFYIKYFDIMYTTVSYIYIVAAILSIKSDLLKEKMLADEIMKNKKNEINETTSEFKENNNILDENEK